MTAFTEALVALPFAPRTGDSTGFLAPITRASHHLLYLLACLADETIEVTREQANTELAAVRVHWDAKTPITNLSDAALQYIYNIEDLIDIVNEEYDSWSDNETRTNNIREVVNRIVAFLAFLDNELLGLAGSDPGSSL